MRDLHIHTKYSDGELDEYQIVEQIRKCNIDEFCITDHDTIEGSKRVYDLLKKQNSNLKFCSGVELTCRLFEYDNGVNMHLLFRNFDYDNQILKEVLNDISNKRKQKIDVMVEFVEKEYGITIPKDVLQTEVSKTESFGKPHLYSILCGMGNFDRSTYYKKMNTLNTSHLKLSASNTIKLLKDCGNFYLAHPVEIMDEYNYDLIDIESIVAILKDYGLKGIETKHSKQTKDLSIKLEQIAKEQGLEICEGSDYHGSNVKPDVYLGKLQKD